MCLDILRNEATVALELTKHGESAVEIALGGGEGAIEKSIDWRGRLVDRESSGLDGAQAANLPAILRKFVNQESFRYAGRLVLDEKRRAEVFELFKIFVGLDDRFRVEAVAIGVSRRDLFTFARFGTSRFLSVLPVDGGAISQVHFGCSSPPREHVRSVEA